MMDDDIQDGGDPAEAFDRLRAVVERQDRELALLRRAVEGLAAERAHIDVPDYSETLGRMQQGVDATADQIAVINDVIARSPALAMTPEQMAQRIAAAGSVARREDQAAFAKAGEDKARVMADLRAIAGSAWNRHDQKNRQLWFGLGGVTIGILAWAILPGLVAREVAPAGWQWPERMAARTLHLPMWDAGRRLLIADSPKNWNVMVDGWNIIQKNSEEIKKCRKVAIKSRDTARCTIKIDAEEGA
ncbi:MULTISPECIES: DUF6118 family protein [Sphingomonas]|jgi:hypothetical protein|uniref:DUF6118 family protein n=1 Tax=Sphingomonas TaxID=13687 RepID=UPI0012E23758|nr:MULTISPECIES: DUF6118 family protein [Sphingomonas]MDY0969436.1 DUF6118 family protein [Sphingomonas sp. CFBP9021]USR02274.1 DUF6118 family protein [Sphingomonas aerolata]